MTKARILADYVAGGVIASEHEYLDGVTSNVQTQLTAKAPLASPTFTGNFTSVGIDDNADATAITIDSSENVGIGETSPDRLLHLKGAASGHTYLKMESPTGSNLNNYIEFKTQTDTKSWAIAARSDDDGNRLDFASGGAGTTASNILVLKPEGNVGIGTDNPGGYYGEYNNLVVASTGHTGMTIVAGTSHKSTIAFADGTSGQSAYEGEIIYDHPASTLRIGVGGSERLKITATNIVSVVSTIKFESLYGNGTSYNNLKWNSANGQVIQDTSSERYKFNIRDIEVDTSKILEARPVSFQDKDTEDECIGLIAEELFEVCPSLVILTDIDGSGNLVPESIAYDRISVFLIAELKKLLVKNNALETKVTALETANTALEARVLALESA